jgi:hypothetical protein
MNCTTLLSKWRAGISKQRSFKRRGGKTSLRESMTSKFNGPCVSSGERWQLSKSYSGVSQLLNKGGDVADVGGMARVRGGLWVPFTLALHPVGVGHSIAHQHQNRT